MDELVISDEDGFETRWPWPEGELALSNGAFVDIFIQAHERARTRAIGATDVPPS